MKEKRGEGKEEGSDFLRRDFSFGDFIEATTCVDKDDSEVHYAAP